jgi:hypothetical protein
MQIIGDWLSLSKNYIFKPWNWIYLEIKGQIIYETKLYFKQKVRVIFQIIKTKFITKMTILDINRLDT